MEKQDILFRSTAGIFSFRVAGILIREGKVLLQSTPDDPGYAFPGGHVNLGELSSAALAREFKEEIGADVRVERLAWVGEIFFPWGDQDCHQINLVYLISLCDETQIPLEGVFYAHDELEGTRVKVKFSWIALKDVEQILLYPTPAKEKLLHLSEGVEQFVYVESQENPAN